MPRAGLASSGGEDDAWVYELVDGKEASSLVSVVGVGAGALEAFERCTRPDFMHFLGELLFAFEDDAVSCCFVFRVRRVEEGLHAWGGFGGFLGYVGEDCSGFFGSGFFGNSFFGDGGGVTVVNDCE